MARTDTLRRHWLAKTLAGVVLGFALAIGVSGVFSLLARSIPMGTRAQLAMWLVMPVWVAAMGGCFLFRSGWRAWLWMGAANVAVYAAFLVPRWM